MKNTQNWHIKPHRKTHQNINQPNKNLIFIYFENYIKSHNLNQNLNHNKLEISKIRVS